MVASSPASPNADGKSPPRTVVIGLGNALLTDDGVGAHVLERLRSELGAQTGVTLRFDDRGGLHLMECMVGFERAIVIDAIRAGAEPGTVSVLTLADLPTCHSTSTHDASLADALRLGHACGAALPELDQVRLVAIEAEVLLDFGETCTPRVAASIDRAAATVRDLLRAWK